MATAALGKEYAVYYFDDESRRTRNISSLDPGDSDPIVNSWGRLTDFSGNIGELVARYAAGVGA